MNFCWNWRKGERIEPALQFEASSETSQLQQELRHLKRAMRDLVALSMMPAAWVGRGPRDVATGLLELLFSTLRLDAGYVCVDAIAGEPACDLLQAPDRPEFAEWIEENKPRLRPIKKVERVSPPVSLLSPSGKPELRLQTAGLGMQTSMGMVVVASSRPDFPGEEEKLLLSVAANQATTALQSAQLSAERAFVSSELLKSEERFRSLSACSPVGIFLTDTEGKCIYTNPKCQSICGFAPDEAMGEGWAGFVHPEDREHVFRDWTETARRGSEYSGEFRWANPQLGVRWTEVRATPVFNDQKKLLGHAGTVEDITLRRQAEEALKESERQFATLANSIPQLAWMANGDGWIFWYNRQWYEYTGTTPQQMEGWGWQSVHDQRELPKVLERWRDCIATGKPFEMVFPLRGADGIFRPFLTRVLPLRDSEGKVVRWFGTNTDIDTEKKKEEALRESEERFRSLSASSPVGIFLADVRGSCLYTNPRCQTICGFPSMEASLGENWATFVHPDDVEHVLRSWQEATSQRKEWYDEFRWGREPGTVHWSVCRGAPMLSDSGEVMGYVGTVEDITERKIAESALLEREEQVRTGQERLHAALAASDTGTFRWNPHTGEFLEFDDNLKRLFGIPLDTTIRVTEDFLARVHPADLPGLLPAVERCARNGSDFEMEYRVLHPDGQVRWMYDRAKMETVNGRPMYLVGACTDITDRKLAQQALLESEKLASVGRLAATVAHEINNPLEAVTNFIYLAKRNHDLPEKVRKQLNLADQELARVTHIAQQTLGFYRDNSRPSWIKIQDAIEDVLALYERKFVYKSLRVEKRIQPGLKLLTLQGELKQVLSNLITNAIDASTDDGRIIVCARKWACGSTRQMEGVRITIADTGTGMPPAVREKAFIPFFTTKMEIGTGLGLWVTRNIVQKHNGSIRFRSRTGAGTAMTVFLPGTEANPEERVN
jgi:PAS domain S-box-containing protein